MAKLRYEDFIDLILNLDVLGNNIDKHLQAMSNGQTNGIPQGSVLMDFIAEILLKYSDELISYEIQKNTKLKEKFKNAAENSSLIRARVSDIVNEIVIKKSVDDYSSKLREKPFTSQFYLTVPGKGYYFLTYAVEVVILLITFFLIKSVKKNIRKNKAEYEELFIKYPETERDLDILVREAKYINKKLKVLIYKDALILYGRGFNFQLLSGFSKVTFDREIRKGRVVSYIAHFHNNFETDEKVKVCSNYKNLREDIDELGKTLKETFGKTVIYNF